MDRPFPTMADRSGYRGRLDHAWRRGNHRGRGGSSSWTEKPDPSASWKIQGELLATISTEGLPPAETASTVSNVEYIASYNWLDGKSPAIIIPGAPPVWAPPSEPPKLKEDSDSSRIYRDGNASRYPKHPYESAVRAVFTMHPQLLTSKINAVACGSTLGNLLRFARGIKMSFRFDAELIGDSVFFVRKENSPNEVIEGLYGYGHAFPRAYTNWEADVMGSVSHQRIIRYSFGGLNFLVRSESDGYLPKPPDGESPASAKFGSTPIKHENNTDISTLLSASSLVQTEPLFGNHIEIRHGGRIVPQDAVFDVKTRSIWNRIDMPGEILPRLWVIQTPNFILGYHNRGCFEDVQVQDIRQDIRDWEKENEHFLGQFNSLIHCIIDVARKSGPGCGLEISRKEDGPIQVRRLLDPDWHALPSDLCQKWAKSTFEQGEGEAQDKSPSERPSDALKNLEMKTQKKKDASN